MPQSAEHPPDQGTQGAQRQGNGPAVFESDEAPKTYSWLWNVYEQNTPRKQKTGEGPVIDVYDAPKFLFRIDLEADSNAMLNDLYADAYSYYYSMNILDAALSPKAYNVGINQRAEAGAGLKDHIHIHVVPRWGGDTNFMTTIGETRVLAEDVDSMYRRLRKTLKTV